MKMKKMLFVLSALISVSLWASAYEHISYDAVSLDGDWEMAYLPYAYERVDYPNFCGVKVNNAVPGYWEDMIDDFRAAGMKDEFRINPWYTEQTFPINGHADDTTLPQIYGNFFYRKNISITHDGAAVLRFEGVRNQVHVWINKCFVDFRAGFSTPFELQIPQGILKKGENEIVLAVANNPNLGYGDYVCGLTTRSVFKSTGGVNGKLELRFLKSDLADVYVTTAKDLQSFTVHVSGKAEFEYQIVDGEVIKSKGASKGDFTLSTQGYAFWSPENPKRYELKIITKSGVFSHKFGIRRLIAEGEKFKLNGRPVYLRGVTEHCYFAKTIHLPRDLEYYRMITRKRKELGFNFVRFHTFVPPVEYLEATDELGMLVHIESPNFVTEPEYAAIIAFARSHPSVVIYCTGNETRIDRLAETYLEDVAALVHSMTDSLFSPMSAMRGIEYALMKGKDVIVDKPFRHNPERLGRVSKYCDMFTSYQLGLTSYESLNQGTSADLDAWGDAYCGKPRTSHEICIDGSYVDLALESQYDANSPILKTGLFSGIRNQLKAKGVLDRADTYFRNSCEWMWRIRKFTFEKLRAADRVAGYDFLGDINTHWHTYGYSVGMMDEFYNLKPGETVENVLRYNSAAVLLADLGSDFNVTAGSQKTISFKLSNYDADSKNPVLKVSLCNEDGTIVTTFERACQEVMAGTSCSLGSFDFAIPNTQMPRKYFVKASYIGGNVKAENEWELYSFPKVAVKKDVKGVRVVTSISESKLLELMSAGERVLLFGAGPFNSLPTTFRIGMAGRCSGNFATVIKSHPALVGLPHDGYCGWQFRRLLEGGKAVQLEGDVPFDPIIDIASAVKCVIKQAGLFEYQIGEGRLMVCSLKFNENDPAAMWLKNRLISYAESEAFNPTTIITAAQLHSVISAPKLSGAANSNLARNPNDPSSDVRAEKLAQP